MSSHTTETKQTKTERSERVTYLSYLVEISAVFILLWAWVVTLDQDVAVPLPRNPFAF
jgi:hypothetical protein